MKKSITSIVFLCALVSSYAAPFQNLGFDEVDTNKIIFDPDIPQSPPFNGYGRIEDLLPGWQIFAGTNQIDFVRYQQQDGVTSIPFFLGPQSSQSFPIEGGYALAVGGQLEPTSLIQRGDIPPDARWLSYSFANYPFDVSINGQQLPFPGFRYPVASRTERVFDISAYAGQNVELKLTMVEDELVDEPDFYYRHDYLDSIEFIVPLSVESDFNGDGASDIVFEHPDGFVGVWFMNKGPDLISASFFNPAAVADPRWHIVGTGNSTKTTKTDLLFQHEDGSLAVWSMDGTNLVSATLLNPSQPGAGWKVAGIGDMNRDGKRDILLQHTDGTLAVWFMDGINLVQGTWLNPSKPGEPGWRVVGTAALSSTGNTDLILQHTDGTLAAWYMDGTNLVRGALLNPSAPAEAGWRVATTLDLNGDGKTDLLFQHNDGTAAVWVMDGINLISGEFLNPENPGAGWRIAGPK